ncbi:hypothetical protein PVA17_14880 [Lysinibacillus sp. CNPSo 3705]|uniref:hypothetical protein n=1 Tax=Lysinibacillus sp. CNPSo 3705 TaxID=3028148 RepID=UPI00236482DC|nr:hypothetical protein [Lysinibacillus sp. CNPSo 3705]MDD1504030.1 hypothetical protein [Lysinibacillus sp. CNPSo 3705]
MQSLTNISLKTIVKKQVKWKAKLYISALSSLVIVQIIFGLLTSSAGSGSSGYGGENLTVHFSNYSLDTFLIVTAIWAFIVALLFTTKAYRIDDLSVISSRTSSAIANIFVMIIYSFIAVIIMISTYYLQVFGILLVEKKSFIIEDLFISPSILLLCFSSVCLFGAIGLLLGTSFKGPVVIKILVSTLLLLGLILFFMSPESINVRSLIMLSNLMISVLYLLMALLCFSLTIWIADKAEVTRK